MAAMRCLLDELAALIERIEDNVQRSAGILTRLIPANAATTRSLMEGIGAILHGVATPEVRPRFDQYASWRTPG